MQSVHRLRRSLLLVAALTLAAAPAAAQRAATRSSGTRVIRTARTTSGSSRARPTDNRTGSRTRTLGGTRPGGRTTSNRAAPERQTRTSGALSQRLKNGRTRATRKPPVFRVLEEGRLGLLVRMARTDPFLRHTIDAVLRDGSRLISNTGGRGQVRAREAWVPLMSDRPLRRAMIRTILRDMNGRSAEVKDLVRKSGDAAVWDTIFIGAGVHTAAAANALSQKDPSHAMLVIESGDLVSANFASLGQTIAINSSNRQETGEGVQPFGRGNNNPGVGPVGVPDLSGDKWPAADTLSDVATVSLASSGADVMTHSKVTRVSERQPGDSWPARYKIETSDGLTVYAATVVAGSGLGKPKVNVKRGARIIANEIKKVDLRRPDRVPGIVYYEQAMALANQSAAPRDPYRAAPGGRKPRIAVIGGGDSGKTFLELMYGVAPSGAYDGPGKRDRTQRGDVGDVDWVVGPSGASDLQSFVDTVRPRYGRIAPEIKSSKVNLVNKRFAGVERSGKRYRIVYDDGSKSTETYDHIVIATGFESEAPEVLRPILPRGYDTSVPFTRSNALERVKTKVVSGGKAIERDVAKRVVGQDVYFIGPASGNDLVSRDQILVGADRSSRTTQAGSPQIAISENLASIKFLVPYSAALARNVLPRTKADGPVLDTSSADVKRRVALIGRPGRQRTRRQAKRIRRAKVADADDPASDPARTGIEPIVLKHEMATVLDEFTFPRMRAIEVKVSPAAGGLLVQADQLDADATGKVRDAIEGNYALVQMLTKFANVGKTVRFHANIDIKSRSIDVESLSMGY